MRKAPRCFRTVAAALAAASVLAAGQSCSPKRSEEPASGPSVSVRELSNGMKVVMVQNRSAPMICSTVIVKAGVVNETPELNGASHMLEHLLFNGTSNRTQEQIYNEVDFYGGYNNATTRTDHTMFQILMPAEHIEHGLDVQSDMLFNSTLPAEKLEKERGIVIEEIGKDEDDPGYEAGLFFDKIFYGDSPMGMPALGSRETVSAMTREAIAEYYHRYYRPENMVALVMGDFRVDDMTALMERYYGNKAAHSTGARRSGRESEPPEASPQKGSRPWEPYSLYTTRLEADRNYVQVSWPAPGWDSEESLAYATLEWLLNSGSMSSLDRALNSGGRNLALLSGAGYAGYKEGGIFSAWAQTPPDVEPREVAAAMLQAVRRLASDGPGAEEYRGAAVSMTTQDIYNLERIHYFVMFKAPMLAVLTPSVFARRIGSPPYAPVSDVVSAARALVSRVPFVACAAGPSLAEEVRRLDYSPASFAAQPAEEQEATAVDLSAERLPLASERATRRVEIEGGPVVIVKQNPDSRVFAVHVLVKDRAAFEPPGKDGIADMLHRLLPAGAGSRDREAIERELNSIGAELKVTDNPYIPYDDYYFSPEYSYIRLTTIDVFYKRALRLLGDLVTNPVLQESEIERVRGEMLAAASRAEAGTRSSARRLFYRTLFEGTPLARPPEGSPESISSTTRDDLVAFHSEYLHPSNLVISVVSNIEADNVVSELKEALGFTPRRGAGPRGERAAPAPPPSRDVSYSLPATSAKTVRRKKARGQGYIYMGYVLHPEEQDEAALAVATRILSDRMAFEIRERRGLAYSVGASLALRPQGAWLIASMGTRPENIEEAREAIEQAFDDMSKTPVEKEEIQRTLNSMAGRYLMRTLSSMGQAYYACLAEFFGAGRQGEGLIDKAKRVSPEDIDRASSKYFSSEAAVTVIVE